MRILGIDPGIGTIGFGIIESDGFKHKLVDGGVIKTSPKEPVELRLKTIYEELTDIIKETKPSMASVEKLFFSQNITTGIAVAQARGVILLCLAEANLQVLEFTPLQIKSGLVGYGKADKAQVQEMVRVLLNLKKRPSPDDAADALGAALIAAMTPQAHNATEAN